MGYLLYELIGMNDRDNLNFNQIAEKDRTGNRMVERKG